ncbi:AAA family ATPase [Halosquirtibacter laminarini]|uniref:AAA family ATPase n=1 Tax=Halosquirtibacter laminarini TaxID=3374600 RepID=A0AC61NEY5_9BACT|nr:AAA family ATPase [Prolixibacteraceae bacterium]
MLKRFTVNGFKSFKDTFVFELDKPNGYNFNTTCVKNGVINHAIVYGRNAVGKSNLGLAIFDIVSHLTDKESKNYLYNNYLNAENDLGYATFEYLFEFEGVEVRYCYTKKNYNKLIYEALYLDGKLMALSDLLQKIVHFKGTENLNKDIIEGLSIVKYIKSNTTLRDTKEKKVFDMFLSYIDRMLFFRSLEDRVYLGLEVGTKNINEDIIDKGHVQDLELFLQTAGVDCKLKEKVESNEKVIAFDFGEGRDINLFHVASQGTRALVLFYYWLQRLREESTVSFLFIDEFDVFYHHDLSEFIVKELKNIGIQFILTTHNTSIMTNDLLRPDCYFVMNSQKIKSLPNLTKKELREAHNLSKIYSAGGFDVK